MNDYVTMSRRIVLRSDAVETYKDNTLTSFKNRILHGQSFDSEKLKLLNISSLGFFAKFKNNGCPKNINLPSVIVIPGEILKQNLERTASEEGTNATFDETTNLNLSKTFSQHHMMHLSPFKSYNMESLKTHFKHKIESYCVELKQPFFGWICEIDEENGFQFGQFGQPLLDKMLPEKRIFWTYMLFFHYNFAKALGFEDNDHLKPIHIDGEKYLWTICDDHFEPIKVQKWNLVVPSSEPILIASKNIDLVRYNSTFNDIIKICVIDHSEGDYCQVSFKKEDFHPLQFKRSENIEIRILNSKFEPLPCLDGIPTYIQADIKQTQDQIMSQFNIHVTSERTDLFPENKSNQFCVKLKDPIHIHDLNQWKVSLNSITFDNAFLRLESLKFYFSIKFHDINPNLQSMDAVDEEIVSNVMDSLLEQGKVSHDVLEETDGMHFEVPIQSTNHQDIFSFFKKSLKPFIDVSKVKSGEIQLKFKRHCTLSLASDFAAYMGSPDVEIKREKDETYFFAREININSQLKTNSIYIFSSICDLSVIGEKFCPLLKIVKIPNKVEGYCCSESERHEFVPLSHAYISEIHFTLASHDGTPLNFIKNDATVFLTLTFQKTS